MSKFISISIPPHTQKKIDRLIEAMKNAYEFRVPKVELEASKQLMAEAQAELLAQAVFSTNNQNLQEKNRPVTASENPNSPDSLRLQMEHAQRAWNCLQEVFFYSHGNCQVDKTMRMLRGYLGTLEKDLRTVEQSEKGFGLHAVQQ